MKFLFSIMAILFVMQISGAKDDFKIIHTKDLDQMIKAKKSQLYIYDANLESTRKFVGIIPGAKLLNSSNDYDVQKELPSDKKSDLVFYCANSLCTASHSAAQRALDSGYTHVSVMVDGIYGWKSAGLTLATVTTNSATQSEPTHIEIANNVNQLSPKDVNALENKKEAIVIDVRESEERHQIIEGSKWFPMSKIKDDSQWVAFRTQLPQNKTIIFHCAAGIRAKKVATLLAKDGFHTAFFEGPDQWEKAGLPLQKGPAQPAF